MPVSCHFQGCKALLRPGKRCYIKYHAFAIFDFLLSRVVFLEAFQYYAY